MEQIQLNLEDIRGYSPRTYYFPISHPFDSKLLDKFVDMLNSVPLDDHIEIHINSHGGETAVLFFILKTINENPDRFSLTVSGAADSAALDLVLLADCKKRFLPSFIGGVAHSISFKTETRDIENAESISALVHKAYSKVNRAILKYFNSLELDPDKMYKLEKGEDILFSREEVIKACRFKEANNLHFKIVVK